MKKQTEGWNRHLRKGVNYDVTRTGMEGGLDIAFGQLLEVNDPARSQRITQALMKMTKLDMKTLPQAYFATIAALFAASEA